MPSLEERAANIKLVAFDFDGVFTDNHVYTAFNADGVMEMVRCSRADGIGLDRLRALGVHLVVISTEPNPVVKARCDKLKIACHQGVNDKRAELELLAAFHGVSLEECGFLGNDVNDLEALKVVGLPALVNDHLLEMIPAPLCTDGYFKTGRAGGEGAVREFCDWIADAKVRSNRDITVKFRCEVVANLSAHIDRVMLGTD